MSGKLSETYRANAERERELAASSTLPQATAVHLRAAERWEQLAAQTARVEDAR